MCSVCKDEYKNPLNRRFHAQPNACHTCGPHIYLTDNSGRNISMTEIFGDKEIPDTLNQTNNEAYINEKIINWTQKS